MMKIICIVMGLIIALPITVFIRKDRRQYTIQVDEKRYIALTKGQIKKQLRLFEKDLKWFKNDFVTTTDKSAKVEDFGMILLLEEHIRVFESILFEIEGGK